MLGEDHNSKENHKPVWYNAVRVYTGKIEWVGNWGDEGVEYVRFRVLSGKVHVKKLSPVKFSGVYEGKLNCVVLYPITKTATVRTNWGWSGDQIIELHKYNGHGKSVMYKQKI